jgi:metal-responsive CopG/Arc/MetJ family transcriptional regulator
MTMTTEAEKPKPGRRRNPNLTEVSLVIPRQELAELDQAADEEAISRSLAVRQAVKTWLKGRKR